MRKAFNFLEMCDAHITYVGVSLIFESIGYTTIAHGRLAKDYDISTFIVIINGYPNFRIRSATLV